MGFKEVHQNLHQLLSIKSLYSRGVGKVSLLSDPKQRVMNLPCPHPGIIYC